ncbi:tyrosine-type recombinase/integrase [Treponema brennaborense]|uniref:tyrosine-type recombinase/integrase n=1 Tax=Treponema brennaborense TaxID=81028 RepID=UPI0002F5A0BB|nr:tyrosine-type recombinase/integrase [Treponema brennaborense]
MYQLENILAMYTGMRAGEIQTLRVEDIHEDYILVAHSWDDYIGIKSTKNGEDRPVPISKKLHDALLQRLEFNPWEIVNKVKTERLT